MRIYALLLFIFSTTLAIAQATGTIRGFVYDKSNGEPVMFTNVKIKGTGIGSPTDVNGFYQISNAPVGDVVLEVTNITYSTKEVKVHVEKGKIVSQNIYLEENDKLLDEVVVSAEGQEAKKQVKMSMIKATKKEIQAVPSVGGEADLATYFQTVPGVITTGDQGGQMYVRGGSPVQNKVLLDGMVVYNPFHSIGFFSVFDTEIIRNADIYTGGFGAQYGGRISSVMDIRTIDGNKQHFSGRVAVNPFGSKITLEGPIKKMKEDGGATISYVFSGKTSYLEKTSKLFYSYVDTAGLPFNYTDLYGKVSINGANGSKANFFGYNFSDNVKWKELLNLRWDSHGAGANFVMVPAATPVLIEGKFNFSDYKISLAEIDPTTGLFKAPRTSQVNGFSLGFDFKYFKKDDEIKYGIELNGFKTDFSFTNSVGRKLGQVENTTQVAGYIDYKIVRRRFVINPGFRMQYYTSLGNFSPEPRLGIKYNANEKLRFKFASGVYSQNLISANSDRDVVNLFYGFLSGPDNLQKNIPQPDGTIKVRKHKLQKATHAIFGFEYDLAKHWGLNVEGYYKWFTQLTNMNKNKIYDDTPENSSIPDLVKKDFIIETGAARGVDVVLKYSDSRYYLWAVYSLGKVTRWDGVQTYAPVYDRRHNINLVGTYLMGKKKNWELNVRWNFGSGLPFTQIQGFTQLVNFNQNGIGTDYTTANSNNVDIVYGNIYKGRLSAYHRLDIALKRKIELKNKSKIEITASVTNAYSRKNIFYVEPVTNNRVYQLPILPSIGFSWRF